MYFALIYFNNFKDKKEEIIVHKDIVIVTNPCQSGDILKLFAMLGQTLPIIESGNPNEMNIT